MAATFALTHANALLLRGTEGEAVADPRRTPTMQAFVDGQTFTLQEHQAGPLTTLPDLPTQLDAATTAAYIQRVMAGEQPVPTPIAQQVAHILHLVSSL
jgi:anthranilate phosphoribosyltransferase